MKKSAITALLVGALAVGSIGTYATIDNDWAPELTGSYLSQSEHKVSIDEATETAREEGYSEGHSAGFDAGELNGFAEGQDAGHDAGYRTGRNDGYNDGYQVGYNSGGQEAYDNGYYEGYDQGWVDGCVALFDALGTDRVGDWWDYYYSPSYASYFNTSACG